MESDTGKNSPIFAIIAVCCFLISLFSPILFITIPVMITVIFSLVSIFRKERPKILSPIVASASVLLLIVSNSSLGNVGTQIEAPKSKYNLSSAELENFSWVIDPQFAGKGTVKWKFSVHNNSNKSISLVKVEFTSYDKDHKLLASDFTYIEAIPAGETRSKESYADYYHNEQTANAVITEVRFSGE